MARISTFDFRGAPPAQPGDRPPRKGPAPKRIALSDLMRNDPQAPLVGLELRFCCLMPACRGKPIDAAHRSVAANIEQGVWQCHRCKAAGVLVVTVADRARLDRAVAAEGDAGPAQRPAITRSQPTHRRPATRSSQTGDFNRRLREELAGISPVHDSALATAYFDGRCVPLDVAHGAEVRFAPKFFGLPAAVFPIRRADGKLVAVHGRYIDGRANPKCRTCGPISGGVFSVGDFQSANRVAVVEGPFDVLSLRALGYPVVVGLIGTSWPKWLPPALVGKDVLLATDADAAGDACADSLGQLLHSLGGNSQRLRPHAGKDWNDVLITRSSTL